MSQEDMDLEKAALKIKTRKGNKPKASIPLKQDLTRLATGAQPARTPKLPLASYQNARRVGGYGVGVSQNNPPYVAYRNIQADTWFLPAALTPARRIPPKGSEVVRDDPSGIHKQYVENYKYFNNLGSRDFSSTFTNVERTPMGGRRSGKYYNPRGCMVSMIEMPANNAPMPYWRGY